MFGIDLVIPDFTYVLENKDRIKGLFITHGHEDHIGSLPYLLKKFNVPIYAARLTIGLIKNKLEEHGLASSAIFHEIRPRQKVTLGCFTVEPIHVNHSIPDSLAFAIDCPAGVVIHTGRLQSRLHAAVRRRCDRPAHDCRIWPQGRSGSVGRLHER